MNSRIWALGVVMLAANPAFADDNTVTIGMILPMTGQQASTGKQEQAGAQLISSSTAIRSPAKRSS